MDTNFRKKFLVIVGSSYKEYGMSPVCGWIEALLGLENQELMQAEISELLIEILGQGVSGTSISSVNRAIKILKHYGAVKEYGNSKIGYKYVLNTDYDISDIFIQFFLLINRKTLKDLKKLEKEGKTAKDNALIRAIQNELTYLELMDEYFEESKQILEKLKKKYFPNQKARKEVRKN